MTNATILLVEDNPDEELLTPRALRKNKTGDQVFVVHDGEEALDFLFCAGAYSDRNPNELTQLILLDIKLPKMDRFAVLRYIRADRRTHLLRVVPLASSKEEQDLLEGYESGANSFMRKPIDYTQFEEFVAQLGSRSLLAGGTRMQLGWLTYDCQEMSRINCLSSSQEGKNHYSQTNQE